MAYALFPRAMARMARYAQEAGEDRLRVAGVIALAAGAGLIWLAQRLS